MSDRAECSMSREDRLCEVSERLYDIAATVDWLIATGPPAAMVKTILEIKCDAMAAQLELERAGVPIVSVPDPRRLDGPDQETTA